MAELPFNIVIQRVGMVCPAICFESCPKKSKQLRSLRGVTDTTNTCFVLWSLILFCYSPGCCYLICYSFDTCSFDTRMNTHHI